METITKSDSPEDVSATAGRIVERRQSGRISTTLPVRVHGHADGQADAACYEGWLRNIGSGGLCVVLHRSGLAPLGPIAVGRIRMEMLDETPPIELQFGIQWKRLEPDGSLLLGVCFNSTAPEAVEALPVCRLIEVWL